MDKPPDTKSRLSRLKSILSFGRQHLFAVLSVAFGALTMAGLGQNAHHFWLVHLGFGVTWLILLVPLIWGITRLLRWKPAEIEDEKAPYVAVILLCFLFIVIVIPFHWDKISSLRGESTTVSSKPPMPLPAVVPASPAAKSTPPIPSRVPRHKPKPKPAVAEPQNAPALISPEVQLAERAVATVENCHRFQSLSLKRLHEDQKRIKEHDSLPDVTEQSKQTFSRWVLDIGSVGDMRLYNEAYKQDFMDVRRLLIQKVPEAVHPLTDYENPGNMGGVTGICFELSEMTDAYLNQLYNKQQISLVEARQYSKRLQDWK